MTAQQTPSDPLPADAIAAIQRGRKIDAIKILRTTHKLGLKEAKDIVDGYMENDPVLARKYRQQSTGAGSILRLLAFAVVVAIGYWLFFGK